MVGIGLIVAGASASSTDPYGTTNGALVYVGAGLGGRGEYRWICVPVHLREYRQREATQRSWDLGSSVSLNEHGLNVTLAADLN